MSRRLELLVSSIRFLRTFLAVNEYGSMAAAANHVSLTQAAVGKQMQALEDEFNRPLFTRSGRALRLTPAGCALVPYVRRILATYEEMLGVEGQSQEVAGAMTVGSTVSAMGFLSENILTLKAQYPGLHVRVINTPASLLTSQVRLGQIDAAIVVMTDSMRKGESWTPLYEEPLVLLANRQVASQNTDIKSLLRDTPFIRFDRTTKTGGHVEHVLRRLQVTPNEILEVNAIVTVMELVRQNIGVSLVPKLRHVDWGQETSLITLQLPQGSPSRQIAFLENLSQATKTTLLRDQLLSALSK